MVASVSKESRASTSVLITPGISRLTSEPTATANWSTRSSIGREPVCSWMIDSLNSASEAAFNNSEGFVVASVGLSLAMASRSPVSATTVVMVRSCASLVMTVSQLDGAIKWTHCDMIRSLAMSWLTMVIGDSLAETWRLAVQYVVYRSTVAMTDSRNAQDTV